MKSSPPTPRPLRQTPPFLPSRPTSPPRAPKPKPPAPKKKTPPVFPGPKTLPPTGPYKVLFFENDFSYKKDPNHEHVFGEEAKLMPFELFDVDMVLSTGGELRHRFIDQSNRLQPGARTTPTTTSGGGATTST